MHLTKKQYLCTVIWKIQVAVFLFSRPDNSK